MNTLHSDVDFDRFDWSIELSGLSSFLQHIASFCHCFLGTVVRDWGRLPHFCQGSPKPNQQIKGSYRNRTFNFETPDVRHCKTILAGGYWSLVNIWSVWMFAVLLLKPPWPTFCFSGVPSPVSVAVVSHTHKHTHTHTHLDWRSQELNQLRQSTLVSTIQVDTHKKPSIRCTVVKSSRVDWWLLSCMNMWILSRIGGWKECVD